MSAPKLLFIGGTGTISSACSRLAVEKGYDLTLLNRGKQSTRPPIEGARSIVGDASEPESIRSAIGTDDFDVVVNFRSYLPAQTTADIEIFTGRTGQYVYISSASAYQKPVGRLPIVESTPLRNPFWQYSRDKIASEDLLVAAYRDAAFPATIVRPSHTYDLQSIPLSGGWTDIDRMRRGKPVVVHGDGTSLWTLTYSDDFAIAFVGLLGHPKAIGDSFHITSDEFHTWDAIAGMLGAAAGAVPEIVHVSSDEIARALPEWGPGIVGDKAHSVVFDNSKVKALVPEFRATTPYWRGARMVIDHFDSHPELKSVDGDLDAQIDDLVAAHR